jgi:hypothetical protein
LFTHSMAGYCYEQVYRTGIVRPYTGGFSAPGIRRSHEGACRQFSRCHPGHSEGEYPDCNKQLLTLQQRSTNLNSQVQTANSTAKSLPQLTALFAPAVHIPLPQQPLQSPKPQQAPAQQTQVQQAQQQTAILQSQIADLQEQSAALQQELTIFQQQNQELVNTAKQAAAATQATATPPDVAVIDAWMPLILTALILIGGAVVWFKDKDPEHRKWVYSAFSAVLGFWFKSAGS